MKWISLSKVKVLNQFAAINALALCLAWQSNSWAQTIPTSAQPEKGDAVDVKELEAKYWSAKEKDFSVVQNRTYKKEKRFSITGEWGVPFNDPFSSGALTNIEIGYFWNEKWGLAFSHTSTNLHDNEAVDQFVSRYGIYPDHNVSKAQDFIEGKFVPLYAKMSWLDQKIIYFDMGLTLGLGQAQYTIKKEEGDETRSSIAIKVGIFQQIFFSEHLALRVDLNNISSQQNKMKYRTNSSNRDLGSSMFNDTQFLVGLTYWH